MPLPLSWICSSARPPPFAVTVMDVAPASSEFSIISFSALKGRWMTSPAAILLTTAGSRRSMRRFGGAGIAAAAAPPAVADMSSAN